MFERVGGEREERWHQINIANRPFSIAAFPLLFLQSRCGHTSTGKGDMESSSSGITLYPYLASLNQAQLKGSSWPVTSPQTASLAELA